jgi:hypothetical protein
LCRSFAVAVVVCLLAGAPGVLGSPGGPGDGKTGTQPGVLRVAPGKLTAKATYADGSTPVSKRAVKLWSGDKKEFVGRTRTDTEGVFSLEDLRPGSYLLVIGDRQVVRLRVSKKADRASSPVRIFMPRGKGKFSELSKEEQQALLAQYEAPEADAPAASVSAPAGENGGFLGGGLVQSAVVGVGSGAAVVGVADATDTFEDDDTTVVRQVVSPSR